MAGGRGEEASVAKQRTSKADLSSHSRRSSSGALPFGLLIAAGVYLLPTIVAKVRGVPNFGSVLVINLFLDVTLVGWVVALAMAARSVPQQQSSY